MMEQNKDKRNAEEKCVDFFQQIRPLIFAVVEKTYQSKVLKKYSELDRMRYGILEILEDLERVTKIGKKELISMLLWRMFTKMHQEEAEIVLQSLNEDITKVKKHAK